MEQAKHHWDKMSRQDLQQALLNRMARLADCRKDSRNLRRNLKNCREEMREMEQDIHAIQMELYVIKMPAPSITVEAKTVSPASVREMPKRKRA